MNLRRGLFRIWLIVSALFIISVVVDSYSELRRKFADNGEPTWFDQFAVLPVDCAEARGLVGEAYERRDGFCWYEMEKFRKLYPEYNDLNHRVLRERLYAKAGYPPDQGPWSLLLEKTLLGFGYRLRRWRWDGLLYGPFQGFVQMLGRRQASIDAPAHRRLATSRDSDSLGRWRHQ